MKAVYWTTDPLEANFLQMILRERGIRCILENEGGAMYAIGLPSAAVPLVLTVLEEDADRAEAAIGEALKERRPRGEPEAPPQDRRHRGIWALYASSVFPPAILLLFMRPDFRWLRKPTVIALAIGLIAAIPFSDTFRFDGGYILSAYLCISWSLIFTAVVLWLKGRTGKPR